MNDLLTQLGKVLSRRTLICLTVTPLLVAGSLFGQTTQSPGPEANLRRPADIYKDAMQPLDVVRESMDNWSDSELSALAAGMRKANLACEQATPQDYSGEDLYDLARLCALGQDWNIANDVALKYLAGTDQTHRARAFAISINAQIHVRNLDRAIELAKEMLGKLPYDAAVAESVGYLITYLEESLDPAALELASEQRLLLLEALGRGMPLQETHGNDAASIGVLYESGMQLAFLQRFAGEDQEAVVSVAELKGALAKSGLVGVEDQRIISAVDARYSLLGAPIPAIEIYRSLFSATAKAKINQRSGIVTVLVLSPDWCTQCRKMMKPLTALALKQGETEVHAYGLVFQDAQKNVAKAPADDSFKDLQGTSTLLVSPTTASLVGATDFPLGIVTGKDGKIRYVGRLASNAFDANGFMDQIVGRVADGLILPRPILPPTDRETVKDLAH